MASFGATSLLLASGTEVLAVAERTHLLPSVGVVIEPIYLVSGLTGGVIAGALAPALGLAALVLIERAIRFASQLQAVFVLREFTPLEVAAPQVIALLVGVAIGVVAVRAGRIDLAGPHDILVAVGSCFFGVMLALLPLRLTALSGLHLPGPASLALIAALATVPAVAAAAHLERMSTAPVRIAMAAAALVVAGTVGTVRLNIDGRPLDEFTLAATAPLLATFALIAATRVLRTIR